MAMLTDTISYLLPALGLLFVLYGFFRRRMNYILIALWVSLVTLLLQYQIAGSEILGSYFGYKQSMLYTINLVVLVSALIYMLFQSPQLSNKYIRILFAFLSSVIITAVLILIINLWVNAYFIENRFPGTAIMQVVSFTPPDYCSYRYVFYKVGNDSQVHYLCPNYYGLIPATGTLDTVPDFLTHQLKR